MAQTILVAPTLTAQVRDIVYTLGQQQQAALAAATTVTRHAPIRGIGVKYTNTGAQAMFVYVSLSTGTAPTTSYLYIGGATVAEGQHVTVGQSAMLAGVVNPKELYFASSTASSVTVLNWTEYGL